MTIGVGNFSKVINIIFFTLLHEMKYTHVFFDLDHTLWDFDKNSEEAMGEAFQELSVGDFLGVEYSDFNQVYKRINQKYWERFRKGFCFKK